MLTLRRQKGTHARDDNQAETLSEDCSERQRRRGEGAFERRLRGRAIFRRSQVANGVMRHELRGCLLQLIKIFLRQPDLSSTDIFFQVFYRMRARDR